MEQGGNSKLEDTNTERNYKLEKGVCRKFGKDNQSVQGNTLSQMNKNQIII